MMEEAQIDEETDDKNSGQRENMNLAESEWLKSSLFPYSEHLVLLPYKVTVPSTFIAPVIKVLYNEVGVY